MKDCFSFIFGKVSTELFGSGVWSVRQSCRLTLDTRSGIVLAKDVQRTPLYETHQSSCKSVQLILPWSNGDNGWKLHRAKMPEDILKTEKQKHIVVKERCAEHPCVLSEASKKGFRLRLVEIWVIVRVFVYYRKCLKPCMGFLLV